MILGRVVGTVWATRKHAGLRDSKLLVVRPHAAYAPTHDVQQLVAVDHMDAGIGDDVVVCLGAPSRWSLGGDNLPVDAAVLGVVDRCQLLRGAFVAPGSVARRGRRLAFHGAGPRNVDWIE